jgi:hypothetical protein
MNDAILDFGFAICDLSGAACGPARGGHDGGQFVGFLLDCPQFRNELGFRTPTAGSPVVGAYRGAAPHLLAANGAAGGTSGQSANEFDHPQREQFRALFQFCFRHQTPWLSKCVTTLHFPIANRNSKIKNS